MLTRGLPTQLILMLSLGFFACQPSLERQPKIGILQEPRRYVEGTVPFSQSESTPPKLTRALVWRGQERYEIYCSVCHGFAGFGDGLATERGFGRPNAFDLENQPIVQIEKTIANGKGRMLGFADRIPETDRHAIAVYSQILSLRSHFPVKALSRAEEMKFLDYRGNP